MVSTRSMSSQSPELQKLSKRPRNAKSSPASQTSVHSIGKATKQASWAFDRFEMEAHQQVPFQVGQHISLKGFHNKCRSMETGPRYRLDLNEGKVYINEVPSSAHEAAAGAIMFGFSSALGNQGHDIDCSSSPRCGNGRRSSEPDGALRPLSKPNPPSLATDTAGLPYPNIIIEVAKSESEEHALEKAQWWLDVGGPGGVQLVIVIKIGSKEDTHTLKAWVYRNGYPNPIQMMNFGRTALVDGAVTTNLPNMQIEIPLECLYYPDGPPDVTLQDPLLIDLYYVCRKIERALQ
jgi:Uma2 family endonuclease